MALVTRKPETLTESVKSGILYQNAWARFAHCMHLLVSAKLLEQRATLRQKVRKASKIRNKTFFTAVLLVFASPFFS